MARHVIGVIVGSVALATSLSGCLLSIDDSGTDVWYINNYAQPVTVLLEGEPAYDMLVKGRDSQQLGLDECTGTAIRVETKDGEILGRILEPACPGGELTINEDGSLDYVEDE